MTELEILFPTCNSEKKFISESLEAIKRQTFKDFKLLIIDNQSTDKTIDIITKSGLPFKVISKKDLSFNDGIKKGLKMVKAKYFTILSTDDVIEDRDYFKKLIFTLKKNNDVDIAFPDYGEIIGNNYYKKKIENDFKKIAYNIIVPGLGWIAKKEIITFSHFPANLEASSDYYFLLNLYKQGFKFLRVNGPRYYLRIGGNSFLKAFKSFSERKKISIMFGGNFFYAYIRYYIVCFKFIIKFKILKMY